MNIKNNRRSRDTEERVEKLFLELLSEKHISKITVSELCKGAGITRTSFYGHYQDVYDLLEKVQKRMTSQILTIIEEEWSKCKKDPGAGLIPVLTYIEENKEFFQYFLKNADLKTVFSSGQMSGLIGPSITQQDKMYLTFVVGGLNALLTYWIGQGCKETPEEVLGAIPEQSLRLLIG